jgi:hypothetical protein
MLAGPNRLLRAVAILFKSFVEMKIDVCIFNNLEEDLFVNGRLGVPVGGPVQVDDAVMDRSLRVKVAAYPR